MLNLLMTDLFVRERERERGGEEEGRRGERVGHVNDTKLREREREREREGNRKHCP